jgi:hypothetical protein
MTVLKTRKLFKIAGISAAVLIGIVLVIAVILWLTIDADLIESALEKQISREVEIGGIRAGVFSALTGFRVDQLSISHFRSPEQLGSEEKIPEEEIFMRLGSLRLNFEFWPLLRRQLRVHSVLIDKPEIRLIRYPDGTLNVSDLMAEGSADKEMGAGDLPLSVNIDRIRVSDGILLFEDQTDGSRYRIHGFDLEVYDIRIDPRNLNEHNSLRIRGTSSVESVLIPAGGFAQEVEAEFRMQGRVRPFDPVSGTPEPEVDLKVETPSGRIRGSELFASLRSSPLLDRFGITPDFLPEDLDWKDGSILLSVAGDVVRLEEGTFRLEGYGMHYGGTFDLESEAVDADLELLLDRDLNPPVRRTLAGQADAALRPDMKRYVSGDDIAQTLLSAMQDEDQQIRLLFQVSGTMNRPKARLKGPSSADLGAAVQDMVVERARAAGERAVKETLTDKLKGLIKKK